jgi:hypothetical protein
MPIKDVDALGILCNCRLPAHVLPHDAATAEKPRQQCTPKSCLGVCVNLELEDGLSIRISEINITPVPTSSLVTVGHVLLAALQAPEDIRL